MPSQTNEQALEALIEKALTGSSREERADAQLGVAEAAAHYGPGHGYVPGDPRDYDAEFAVDRLLFWRFLDTTQPEELAKLQSRPDWQRLILERLDRKLRRDGIVKLLKDGLAIDDAHFTLFYSPPINDLNPLIAERFRQNIFSVTRQVHFSQADPMHSVDMVLFVNGLAVATIELKNAWTGQTVYHARKQYARRSTQEPLFRFARCVVHFAVDTDEVFMTTKLAGTDTVFLPFNRGHNHGKGNPPNPGGHRTSYLWDEILLPESLANILEHFVVLIGKKRTTPLAQRDLIFPRYHQLDVVRRLIKDARRDGSGQTYLIQHSAGSGKSHSITWTAYQLIEVMRPGDEDPVYDSAIVVTDRRNLDRQISRNIAKFSEVGKIVAHADSSAQLKQHLEGGKRIIITTIQKFPYIVQAIDDLSNRTFAVLIDEAHSSQSGVAHDKLNISLGGLRTDDGEDSSVYDGDQAEDEAEAVVDTQDLILKVMQGRKLGRNASYYAFTATPKNATLEKFGVRDAEGRFRPYDLYSMKQAIEEGFILDVLANYTTYKSYYEIQKSIADNPLFETARAQKKLRAYVEGNRATINAKAEIIVDHFLQQVVRPKKLKGKAKGMVVTRNIVSAIRYYFAVCEALARANSPVKVMIAFSGKKTVDGNEYTEESINGFPSKDIEETFDGDDYRLLVVANKFLTGFDQPKLTVMYVDKKLQDLQAVQTLSRLNRSSPKLGKRTEDLFVLDFFNSVADIKAAFDPYYTATTLSGPTDVNVLHDLQDALDETGVYTEEDVAQFNDLFFNDAVADQLSPILDACADRFDEDLELDEDEQADFKIKAKQFVKIYGQVAGLLPYNHVPWEMRFWFLKFLIPKLRIVDPNRETMDMLLESVDLSTYGLERVKLNQSIGLDATETEIEPQNPNPRGIHGVEEAKDPLDEIVRAFNERWFTGWDATPAEQRVRFLSIAQHVAQQEAYQRQVVDNPDQQNRQLAATKLIEGAMNKKRREDLDLYKRYATDSEFKRAFDAMVMRILQQGLQGGGEDLAKTG